MDTYLEQAHVQLAKQAGEQLDEIEAKNLIVRRQDKLITDLMQKNDLTMQNRQTSQALEQRQAKHKQETQMRLTELKLQKKDFGETVE
jgi:microcompartment protein CcmL/EutN